MGVVRSMSPVWLSIIRRAFGWIKKIFGKNIFNPKKIFWGFRQGPCLGLCPGEALPCAVLGRHTAAGASMLPLNEGLGFRQKIF
ncbi:MAG: hypothetical protein CVV44_20780 [Spirochaetae bacterium HGW-Spirochaetae-1]|nr:MAG: hypothetical protein CVV44_20780 [Spirochaetae bacterium HGW-Spirochaetae-1]